LTRRVQEIRSSQRVSEYERNDAQQLQTRIVPSATVASGVNSLATAFPQEWWAATTSVYGNWRRTCLHFCIADVSGKGTPGALIAAMLYASVSTLSSSSNSPEIILAQVESTLRNQLGEGHYVTIFYGCSICGLGFCIS